MTDSSSPANNDEANNDENNKGSCGSCCSKNCCSRSRFANEFSIGALQVEEKPFGRLDMERNFRMGKGMFSLFGGIKLCFFGLTIASLVVDIVTAEHPNYWMAFLTNWSLLYCIVYQIGSVLLTVLSLPSPSQEEEPPLSLLLKLTWISFSLAAVHQICVFFLFWNTVYYPGYVLTFANVMLHGGVMILILLDGLLLNRTPVRFKHLGLNMVMAILYMVWSVLQNTVCRCNPYADDDEDDDSIYSIMKWREEPAMAIGAFLILLLVVLPVLQILCWAVSLPGRYYLPSSSSSSSSSSSMSSQKKTTAANV